MKESELASTTSGHKTGAHLNGCFSFQADDVRRWRYGARQQYGRPSGLRGAWLETDAVSPGAAT